VLGNFVSGLGTQAALVALPYQVDVQTESALLTGLLGAVELGPLVAMALLGGALADRSDRRRLLLLDQIGLVAVAAALCGAALSGEPHDDKEEALAAGSYDPPVSDLLSVRALNRATLARQLLLERADMTALDAVEHLVGMQAQIPHDPYLGLWSRLASFDPAALGRLLVERKVVRIVVMRGTIHLVSADDCLALRPLMQPVLDAELRRHPQSGPALEGVDVEPVLAYVRTLVAQAPRTGAQLRAAIAQRFPQHDAAALAYACRNLLAFVQVPPRGVWGQTMQVSSTTAEHWLGRPLAAAPSIDEVVVRYIAAFGPATVADIASWSRLTGMRAVVERIAPRLRVFRDERGRALYDLPDAPRPAADTPAPVRFLPEYDNVLLSHADRGRFYCAKQRGRLSAAPPRPIKGTVLVEGVVRATWRIDRGDDGAMLLVDHAGAFARHDAQAVETEGAGMLRFLEPERAAAGGEVRLVRVDG